MKKVAFTCNAILFYKTFAFPSHRYKKITLKRMIFLSKEYKY